MFIYGLIISYFYSKIFLPSHKGNIPYINLTLYPLMHNGMLILPYSNKKAIHLHHWVIYLFIVIINFFIELPKILTGISVGLFIQGIIYKDRFNFICKNPYI